MTQPPPDGCNDRKVKQEGEVVTTAKASEGKTSACIGRPSLERAGEVEERILEAARRVFLEHGLEGASMDLIAQTARSGKPTIYSRYPNKQALFAATVAHRIALKNARLRSFKPEGSTLEERMASIGGAMLRETLTPDFVGLYRVALAEARQFPDLVSGLTLLARRRGQETVANLLAEGAQCGEFGDPARSSDRQRPAARIFADLILLPLLMRALSGENLEDLHREIDAHVVERVAFFLTSCRHGGIA
jgi:AcrR family transcriptional regulator